MPSVGGMIYRKELIEHFAWLAGSKYLDELLDEVIVAIALTAYGQGGEWIRNGAWATAESVVERFELEQFVEKVRSERIL
jgi:hypothetical protein